MRSTRRRKGEGGSYILDGADKDDGFEAEEFAQRVVDDHVRLDAAVESEQSPNRHDYGHEFEDLNPDMGKMHAVGSGAVRSDGESDYCDKNEDRIDHGVQENRSPGSL